MAEKRATFHFVFLSCFNLSSSSPNSLNAPRPLRLFPRPGPNYRGQGAISKATYRAHADDPVGREIRIKTALEAFKDATDARSFRRLSSDYHVNRTTLQHRRDGANPPKQGSRTGSVPLELPRGWTGGAPSRRRTSQLERLPPSHQRDRL